MCYCLAKTTARFLTFEFSGIIVKGVYELWGEGSTHEELEEAIKWYPDDRKSTYLTSVFRCFWGSVGGDMKNCLYWVHVQLLATSDLCIHLSLTLSSHSCVVFVLIVIQTFLLYLCNGHYSHCYLFISHAVWSDFFSKFSTAPNGLRFLYGFVIFVPGGYNWSTVAAIPWCLKGWQNSSTISAPPPAPNLRTGVHESNRCKGWVWGLETRT